MAKHPLPGGKQDIRGYEPAGGGIVVAALQVIEAGLPVIHVPAVTERLQEAKRTRKGACRCHLLSPRIVGIFYHGRAACVNDLDNIALCVAEVVVFCSVKVHRYHAPRCVIAEQELRCTSLHADQDGAVVEVIRVNIVDRLLLSQTVFVVFKCQRIGSVACAGKLLSSPTEGIPSVGGGVPHVVIGDRLSVIAGQLVTPTIRTGFIGVGNRSRRCCGQCSRRVRIDLLVQNVAPVVVLVGDRLVQNAVVFTDQAVCGVVLVFDFRSSLRDLRDVPDRVVFVRVFRVIAVPVRFHKPVVLSFPTSA